MAILQLSPPLQKFLPITENLSFFIKRLINAYSFNPNINIA